MKYCIVATLLTISTVVHASAITPGKQTPPKDGMIKVAVVLGDYATIIDFAGPWEVFEATKLQDKNGNPISPFDLYTVAATKAPIHTTGQGHLTIIPNYSFKDAPIPDIVVLGAQVGGPGLSSWLKKVHADHKVIMSVCTGAFNLAKTGLLNGKRATTHHWYFSNFERQFPNVKLVREVRYVQADPITFTAGGLSSGIDLALHIVDDYFGRKVAQNTADYMEYQGTGWKSNKGISPYALPVTYADWTGKLASGETVVVHEVTRGAGSTFTADIPAEKISGVPASVSQENHKVTVSFEIPGHPATLTGEVNAEGNAVAGTFEQDGKSSPITLTRKGVDK